MHLRGGAGGAALNNGGAVRCGGVDEAGGAPLRGGGMWPGGGGGGAHKWHQHHTPPPHHHLLTTLNVHPNSPLQGTLLLHLSAQAASLLISSISPFLHSSTAAPVLHHSSTPRLPTPPACPPLVAMARKPRQLSSYKPTFPQPINTHKNRLPGKPGDITKGLP